MKNNSEADIDQLLAMLKIHAMEDLIATRRGTPRPELPLQAVGNRRREDRHEPQKPEDYNSGLRRLTAQWLREHNRPYTGDYFERVMVSVNRQMAEPLDWGIRYLDMEPA